MPSVAPKDLFDKVTASYVNASERILDNIGLRRRIGELTHYEANIKYTEPYYAAGILVDTAYDNVYRTYKRVINFCPNITFEDFTKLFAYLTYNSDV